MLRGVARRADGQPRRGERVLHSRPRSRPGRPPGGAGAGAGAAVVRRPGTPTGLAHAEQAGARVVSAGAWTRLWAKLVLAREYASAGKPPPAMRRCGSAGAPRPGRAEGRGGCEDDRAPAGVASGAQRIRMGAGRRAGVSERRAGPCARPALAIGYEQGVRHARAIPEHDAGQLAGSSVTSSTCPTRATRPFRARRRAPPASGGRRDRTPAARPPPPADHDSSGAARSPGSYGDRALCGPVPVVFQPPPR